MKSSMWPNFDMENSKIGLIFQYFFIFILIFTLISQKLLKRWVKISFLRFSRKFLYNLTLTWRIHRSNSFSQNFSFTSSFFAQLVKNVWKNWSNFLLLRFSWKLLMKIVKLILIWRIKKSSSLFQIFHPHLHFWLQHFSHLH